MSHQTADGQVRHQPYVWLAIAAGLLLVSLTERQVEDHADRQSRLDRDIRVDALPTGLATGWSTPGFDGVLRQPDG